MINTLLVGGRGAIGAGLRTYLPRLDALYQITSVDLPGAEDKATDREAQRNYVDLDVTAEPQLFRDLLVGRGLIVCLARKSPQVAMKSIGISKPPGQGAAGVAGPRSGG